MKTIKEMKENWDKTTQSADKKPEKYTDKDGKTKIRMVPVKKEETNEKTLTPAEKKKREEIAKAMERDNPGMDMKKKMAIATWQAKKVAEETEILEAQDPEMEKVKQLVRLGLMYKKDMTKIVRALTLMKDGKAVPQKERGILFDMLGELIGMITGDDAMFNKARKAVKEEKDMNGMCCKHCGDEFGKPKSESCMYDAYNPEGKNWIKKESYTEAKDPGEYDNEGAMAKTQLKGILTDAEHMIKMFSDDQNLPEWVQNKITKAADYLNSAHRYMMNDDDAQMNEDLAADLRREREKQARNKARTATAKTEIDRNKATDKLHKMGLNRSMDRAKHYDARMKLSGLKKEEVELDKEETVSEAGPRHTMTPMRNRFGGTVDPKKFDTYKNHMKKHNLDEPTVRMAHQNPDNPESKKMMKNPKYAKGLELYKASIREEKGEWKTDTGWKKPEPERKDQFGNVIKTKNLAKRLAKMAAKKSAESPKNESATNMRNMKLINKIKKSGTVKSGSMAKDEK
jgi:hypothetical protein